MSKDRLEEICDLRQPILFNYDIEKLTSLNRENVLQNYSSFDIKLRDILNIYSNTSSDILLPIVLKKGIKVIEDDTTRKFISENNGDFLEETTLVKTLHSTDKFIRPHMMSSYKYDYILGSKDNITPFRYEINYRNYFLVLSGSIKIKMAPPKSEKYLHKIKDYENFEFRSLINPWNVEEKYQNDFDKIKCLEVTLEPGKIIFIPAYWWYSIKFEDNKSTIISYKYRTYMNTLAILPNIFISFLQKQNIKHGIIENVIKSD